MIKKCLFFVYFVFILTNVSAVQLSISPPQIDFVGSTGEEICNTIFIQVNGTENLIGKNLWAEEGIDLRKISLHNLTSEDLRIDFNYEDKIEVDGERGAQICVTAKRKGTYHGLLLYKIENKPVQVGIWMNVSVSKGNDLVKITGNAVKDSGDKGVTWVVFPIGLVIILGILFILQKLGLQESKN
jgi:hypothetical protein